jgi:hypothetical protein
VGGRWRGWGGVAKEGGAGGDMGSSGDKGRGGTTNVVASLTYKLYAF